MSDTIREQIITNVKSTLETISTDNGYVNDIESVQRYDIDGPNISSLPTIIITAGPEEKQDIPGLIKQCNLTLYIDIYASHNKTAFPDTTTDEILNTLLGDVEKAIMSDYKQNDLAEITKTTRNEYFESVEGNAMVGIMLEIDIVYKHLANDPTSQ